MSTKRQRGRPRRFQGNKDSGRHLPGFDRGLAIVAELLWNLHWSRQLPEQPGIDRYQDVLDAVARKHGLSPRTLERRAKDLRPLVEPIVHAMLSDNAVKIVWELPATDE